MKTYLPLIGVTCLTLAGGFVLGRRTEIISSIPPAMSADGSSATDDIVTLAGGVEPKAKDAKAGLITEIRKRPFSVEAVRSWNDEMKDLTKTNLSSNWMGLCRLMLEFNLMISDADENDLIELATGEHDWELEDLAVNLIFRRWGELNPDIAAAMWLDEFKKSKSDTGVSGLLESWVAQDPNGAIRWVDSISDDEAKKRAKAALIAPLAATNPTLALEYLSDLDGGWQMGFVAGALYKSLPPEQIPSTASSLKDKKDRAGNQSALRSFIEAWAQSDPETAFDWVIGQGDGEIGSEVALAAVRAMKADTGDPSQVLDKLSPHLAEGKIFGAAASEIWADWILSGEDDAAAMRWIAKHGDKVSPNQHVNVRFDTASDGDVERVFGLLADLPESSLKNMMLQGLVRDISRRDPKQALDVILDYLPPGGYADNMIGTALGNWAAEGNAKEAIQWAIDRLPPGATRNNAISNSLSRWSRVDPAAAADYALEAGDPIKEHSLSTIASRWVQSDPDKAYRFLKENSDTKAIQPFAETYFYQMPQTGRAEQALKEAMKLPDGDLKKDSVADLFRGWAYQDANEAVHAIEDLKSGATRDNAIRGFSAQIAPSDGEAAVVWSLEIDDSEMRDTAIKGAARSWLQNDREAASAWIRRSSEIDDETKAALLKKE